MADPFSIIAGAAGLADVCIRLTKFVKQAKDGFQTVDSDLEELSKEIIALRSVNDLVKHSFEANKAGSIDSTNQQILSDHWSATQSTLAGCQDVVERLSVLVINIVGNENSKHEKLNSLRKYLRQQSKEDEFKLLRQKLNAHQVALQTSLTAVNVIHTRNSQSTADESFTELSDKIRTLGADLQTQIVSLQTKIGSSTEKSLKNAIESAQNVVPLASLNKHFDTPQTVSSIFTGRGTDLDNLSLCIQDTDQSHAQKRFVIYGLPGSGKTQFCCRFASDNKQRFWGVFWIDASSREHAKESFSQISRIGKVEQNERAAKSWLSSLSKDQPWLMIIDNADEVNFPVDECYPDGGNGLILITTRNPMLKLHGTIGSRYYHFADLEETEAISLLLRAADEAPPWSPSTLNSAKDICVTLGCLPLALVHAGKTILSRSCTMETYLSYFKKNWARIRELKTSNETRHVSDANAVIYSSFELIHDGLSAKQTQSSADALDLLKIFSFLHRQRIRIDIFLRAASNPEFETRERERRNQEETPNEVKSRLNTSWKETLKNASIGVFAFLLRLGYRPVLPRMLKKTRGSGPFEELRLREALKVLFQMSLIFANPDPKDDSYSMHPAVHLWVRERPEMTMADQAVWCQATATILSQSLLLPPLGSDEENEIFRRDLLPHVSHVQNNEEIIRARYLEKQESRRRLWPVLQPKVDRDQALRLVKFSLVYLQCGLFEKAEKLQSQVADFALRTLGMENTITMDIMLLLSSTYWQLARGEDAANLQQNVLKACIETRGKDDLKTLKIMDAYGMSRWQQGLIPEARRLHETAVEGMKRVLGDTHVDTLKAMGNLGRAVGKDFSFTEAIEIHKVAFSGLCDKLTPSHLDTLIAKDNLGMAYYDRAAYGIGGPEDLDQAATMEAEVYEQRQEKLGKEHLYTLWAGLNLARIKVARGEIDEALKLFYPGYAIAKRNLGETHFVVLFAKMHYGRILLHAKRYEEAEKTLCEVIEAYEDSRKGHPDYMLVIFTLIRCRNLLGRESETAELLETLTNGITSIFGEGHPWVKYLTDLRNLSRAPLIHVRHSIGPTGSIDHNGNMDPVTRIAKYGHI